MSKFCEGEPTEMKSITERFWSKVQVAGFDECWEWQAYRNEDGYGKILIEGKAKSSHRVCYELSFGEIPIGFEVCHSCDNRACCNPKHLWLGTHFQNTADMTIKKRFAKKLSQRDVDEIRTLRQQGLGLKELANRFGVRFQHISRVVNEVCWKAQED